jgi:replicative DNA helicase
MMFSLEMPTKEVQARLIADLAFDPDRAIDDSRGANVRYGDILKGRADPHQRDRARHAARQLASLPLSVTDEGGLTINDIRAQAQRQFRAWDKAGVQRGAVLIDHIGLVKPHRPSDSKAAETADTVNELKALAKYLKAPIIALCQVNRNTESRNDKRPTLADLNWSGAIEQIADMICLLYRESYYLKRSSNDLEQADGIIKEHDLELLIHKNRSGPICNLEAYVDVACNVVRDKPDPMRRRA